MSALGAIEVAEFDEVGDQPAAPLRLVTAPADGVRRPDIAGLAGVSRRVPSSPRMASNGASASAEAAPRAASAASAPAEPAPAVAERRLAGRSALVTPGAPALSLQPAPLRLTRRGRMVVVILAAVLATVAITAASMAFSGAQAANHGRPGAGYAGMHRIVVQPGQTLWSIAAQAEPSADPRQVIQEILTANSMTGSAVQAGQLLWVPR